MEPIESIESSFKIHHPTTCLIAGPTGCGKTKFVSRIIESLVSESTAMIQPRPTRIVWVYSEWQSIYEQLSGMKKEKLGVEIEFAKCTCTDLNHIYDSFIVSETNLLILDDLMSSTNPSQKKQILQLFTQGSHHRNLTIFYIVQNLFDQGSSGRAISLNSQYIIVFKNPRDSAQIGFLAQQAFPKNPKFLDEAYQDATRNPHTYLVLNLTQECEDWSRVMAQVFPGEDLEVYIQNDQVLPDELLYKG